MIVTDAGYDVNRLVRALWDLPVELVGRIRSDPRDAPVQAAPGLRPEGRPAPSKHGPESRFAKPETWPGSAIATRNATANYGKAVTRAWDGSIQGRPIGQGEVAGDNGCHFMVYDVPLPTALESGREPLLRLRARRQRR